MNIIFPTTSTAAPRSIEVQPILLTSDQAREKLLGGISRTAFCRLTRKHGLKPIADRWSVEALRRLVKDEESQ